jgi:hypothetical protein
MAAMATVMVMHWAGTTKEHYEALRREVNFEGNAPHGGKYHVAWSTPEGMRVVDVWESDAAFHQFLQNRLMPAVQKLKIPGEPKVELFAAHNVFAPNP